MKGKIYITLFAAFALTACDATEMIQPAEEEVAPQLSMTSGEWATVESAMEKAEDDSHVVELRAETLEGYWMTSTIEAQWAAWENQVQAYDTNIEQAENYAQQDNEWGFEYEMDAIAQLNLDNFRWALGNMRGCLIMAGTSSACSGGAWAGGQSVAIGYIEDALDEIWIARSDLYSAAAYLGAEEWSTAGQYFAAAEDRFDRAAIRITWAINASSTGTFLTAAPTIRSMLYFLRNTNDHLRAAMVQYAAGQASGGGGGGPE